MNVIRSAPVQIIPSDQAVALFIFVSKVPTGDDKVELISASVTASDYYRDSLQEPAKRIEVDRDKHRPESETACVIQMK
jgi:hypothetical protein